MERVASGFNPASYSNLPLYNIQAVSAATGVPAITLRSWERRYGVPQPQRDEKGYRLYSERDIAVTRWLKERVQRGVGISRAVNMLHTLEEGQIAAEQRVGFDLQVLRDQLLNAVTLLDEAGVAHVVGEALMVASVEDVALQLLQPVLEEIGDLWAAGNLSVTIEHFASNILRNHIAQLVRISPPPVREARLVVACAPGELHDIGALTLALFLRRRGFGVVFVGASVEPEDFIADVLATKPDAVLISTARVETALGMRPMLDALRQQYSGLLAVGGRALHAEPSLRDTLPGVYLGRDAAEAAEALEAMLRHKAATLS